MVIEFIEGDDRRIFFHSLFLFSPLLPVYLGSLGTLELFVNAARPGIIYKCRRDPPVLGCYVGERLGQLSVLRQSEKLPSPPSAEATLPFP